MRTKAKVISGMASGVVAGLMVLPALAAAYTAGTETTKVVPVRVGVKVDARVEGGAKVPAPVKAVRLETREAVKAIREDVKGEVTTLRTDMKADIAAMQESGSSTPEMREARREEFRKTVETKRGEVKTLIETKRAELKVKLQVIKDEKKRSTVEKVDDRLDAINAKHVAVYSKALEQLDGVLARIISRADKATAAGTDTALVKTTVTAAEKSILDARAAVTAQTLKTYTITVTSEAELKASLETAKQALRTDLTAVQTKVKEAREAVHTAATTLAQIPNVNKFEAKTEAEATVTASTTTSTTASSSAVAN